MLLRRCLLLNRSIFTYVVYGIIGLAVIGLIGQLLFNLAGFVKSLLIAAVIAGALYFLFRRLTKGKTDKKEQRAFLKAAKQSKKRHKQRSGAKQGRDNIASFSNAKSKRTPRKRTDTHLTVIEGKKNKKKNRALF